MEEVLVEGGHISDVGAEITAKLQGVLVEELTPIHSTLTETHKNVEGLSSRFNEMESILSTLCKTVDILQGHINIEDRPKTAGDALCGREPKLSLGEQEHVLVSQLVTRIEHLSSDVSNYDTARQLKEDNLLLRKDLQAYQDREKLFISRMDILEKRLGEINLRPRSGRSRRGSSCGGAETSDLPPIHPSQRSKSSSDVSRQPSARTREQSKERKPSKEAEKVDSESEDDKPDKLTSLVRQPLVSPSRTKKAISILRRSSSSSSSSAENGAKTYTKAKPITAKFTLDSLESEVQITRSDNSILRQDIQVFRHRENQLLRRTQELEETIAQQNNAIMAMSSGGKGKEEKSQVNLNVDFISGDNPVSPRAIVTATEAKPGTPKPDPENMGKPPSKQTPQTDKSPLPQTKPSKGGNKNSGSSSEEDKKKSSDDDAASKNLKSETIKKAESNKNGNGKKTVKIDAPPNGKKPTTTQANGTSKAAKQPPPKATETKASAKPTNGKGKPDQLKTAPGKDTEVSKAPIQDANSLQQPGEKKVDLTNFAAGLQTSIMDGEEWKVIISSKHELETISDFPNNKTVMITPKVVAKEAEKAEKKKEKGVVKTKDGKKVQIDKKLVDPRADPIPKPPQYPCARPPRNYIPAKVVPNASPGVSRSLASIGSSRRSSSNIAIVSPIPHVPSVVTVPSTRCPSVMLEDDIDTFQMMIKQEPIDLDLESVPLPPIPTKQMEICNVAYDSIYDEPFCF